MSFDRQLYLTSTSDCEILDMVPQSFFKNATEPCEPEPGDLVGITFLDEIFND